MRNLTVTRQQNFSPLNRLIDQKDHDTEKSHELRNVDPVPRLNKSSFIEK